MEKTTKFKYFYIGKIKIKQNMKVWKNYSKNLMEIKQSMKVL